jgi:hypothetical protein
LSSRSVEEGPRNGLRFAHHEKEEMWGSVLINALGAIASVGSLPPRKHGIKRGVVGQIWTALPSFPLYFPIFPLMLPSHHTLRQFPRIIQAKFRRPLTSPRRRSFNTTSSSFLSVTMGSLAGLQVTQPFKVLVAGGSYGGLSAALNLQDLCQGLAPRCGSKPAEGEQVVEASRFPIDITIVDERDGYCEFGLNNSMGSQSLTFFRPPHRLAPGAGVGDTRREVLGPV